MLGHFSLPAVGIPRCILNAKRQGRGGIRAVKIAIGKIPFCHPREEEREGKKASSSPLAKGGKTAREKGFLSHRGTEKCAQQTVSQINR